MADYYLDQDMRHALRPAPMRGCKCITCVEGRARKKRIADGYIERDIERAFVAAVEAGGGVAVKLSVPGRRGWPDRLVIGACGVIALVELKRPKGGKLSAQQKRVALLLRERGARVRYARTVAEARRLAKALNARRRA